MSNKAFVLSKIESKVIWLCQPHCSL